MATKKTMRGKILAPDLKALTHAALRIAAEQLEQYTVIDLYGAEAAFASPSNSPIYVEARALAINYIKKGIES